MEATTSGGKRSMSWKRVLWLVAAVASIGLVGVPGASAQSSASPFDDPSVFCTSAPVPAGARNSSSPGITASSITIADASIDVVPLKRLGLVVPDFGLITKAFVDEVNKCGG